MNGQLKFHTVPNGGSTDVWTMMMTSMRSASPLTRSSSQDLLKAQQTQKPPSPTPARSNSFVLSRRSGVVSEQDALRLADSSAFDDDKPAVDPLQPVNTTTAQTVLSRWPAPVLRQRSNDRRARPVSIGCLPTTSTAEAQAQQQVHGQGSQTARADGVDTQLRMQNIALLPNRQLIQQPAESRWRQWNSTPQRNGRPFGDVTPSMTPENGWRPTVRSSGSNSYEQQLLADREAELRAIRSTMEKNEAAILRTMDDQRRAWESELAAERESWESRLRDAESQVDVERQTLMERIHDLERQNAILQSSNVEHAWRSNGHSIVHSFYAANNDEQSSHHSGDEVSFGRGSFMQLSMHGVDGRQRAAQNFTPGSTGRTASIPPAVEPRRPPPSGLNGESTGTDAAALRLQAIPEAPVMWCQHCEAMRSELERVKQEFDAERQQWLAQKRRVISYQKLLQSKYIQLEQRCAELEGCSYRGGLNHVESVNGIMLASLTNGHALREGWHSGPAGSSSSSSSSSLPKLIPFGQAIET